MKYYIIAFILGYVAAIISLAIYAVVQDSKDKSK